MRADARGARLEVASAGFRASFEPRPDEPRAVRIDDRVVTLDRVVPGRGTEFAGGWSAEGPLRIHVRVLVEPALPEPEAAAPAPATACGSPGPARTALPSALAAVPRAVADVELAPGRARDVGGVAVEVREDEHSGRRRGQVERIVSLRSGALVPSSLPFTSTSGWSELARAERAIVRVDPVGSGRPPSRLRVRAFPSACPRVVHIASIDAPTFVWLSTLGHGLVTVGPEGDPALSIQLHPSLQAPVLSISAEQTHDSRALRPETAGHTATFGGYRVSVTDVVPSAATRAAESRWVTDEVLLALHVQVRIARE